MHKAANGQARTDAQRQDMPSSTNKLPIHSAWYFLCVPPLQLSSPSWGTAPHQLNLTAWSSWRCQRAGTVTHSSQLTANFTTAASSQTQTNRQRRKKRKILISHLKDGITITLTVQHACACLATCSSGWLLLTASVCLETDSHKMPACNLIAPLNWRVNVNCTQAVKQLLRTTQVQV